jgi:hypothetical protein
MKQMLLVLFVLLLWIPSLGAQSPAIRLSSMDVALSNDFPLGPYQELSAWNLGLSGRANFELSSFPAVLTWVQFDNNYWLSSPDWIAFGTQLNVMAGLGYEKTVLQAGSLGDLAVGLRLGYGLQFHVANATTSGTTAATYAFTDQVVSLSLPLVLALADKNMSLFLEPRYLISPENNNIKQQLGVLAGFRLVFGSQLTKGE